METPWERLTSATYNPSQRTLETRSDKKLFSSLAMSRFRVLYQRVTGCHVNIHVWRKFRSPRKSVSSFTLTMNLDLLGQAERMRGVVGLRDSSTDWLKSM